MVLIVGCGEPEPKYGTSDNVDKEAYRDLLVEHASFFTDEEFDDYGVMICDEVRKNGEEGYKKSLANSMRVADGDVDDGYHILSGALNVYCPEIVK